MALGAGFGQNTVLPCETRDDAARGEARSERDVALGAGFGQNTVLPYETRNDAARLAGPAAAGPAYRACCTAEGIASLAPDDAGLQHGRARKAGPDARAETRRPCRPIGEMTTAG